METLNPTLTRPRRAKRPTRSNTDLRLRDALILLRLYMRQAPHLTELNGRTSRWMKRHAQA